MPQIKTRDSRPGSSIASFEVLVRKVKETFLRGKERMKQEMIQTYWQTGKYIHEHILQNQHRADYGKKVISNLCKRVNLSESALRDMQHVYRAFPKRIPHRGVELPWRVLRSIAIIRDQDLRDSFIKRAAESNWTGEEVQNRIQVELGKDIKSNGNYLNSTPDYSPITRPKLGTLYTYRLIESKSNPGELKIDQGFSVYKFDLEIASKLKANQIVESKKEGDANYRAVKSDRTEEDLFTYKATVERIIDGDTLFVEIDLGFTNTIRQYLRLRAIDCPELDTEKGKAAKVFVEKLLRGSGAGGLGLANTQNLTPNPVFITSTRSDKFDRYLADVFVPNKEFMKEWESGKAVLKESENLIYLNNALLEKKLAVRMRY